MSFLLIRLRLPRLLTPCRLTIHTRPTISRSHLHTKYSIRTAHTAQYGTSPEILAEDLVIEEETLPGYNAEHYYPVKVGDVFDEKYKVVGKLGYGSSSTVWLCRDIRKKKEYVALKIYINCSRLPRELPIYNHINSLKSEYAATANVRKLLDSFEITGPSGKHTCLVHEAMGMNMDEVRSTLPGGIEPNVLRHYLRRGIFRGLLFLHEVAEVIHTDIQPKNILVGVKKPSVFARFEQDEQEHPMPRKETPSGPVYISRPMRFTSGDPSLSDLSEARFGNAYNDCLVMPNVYRAPEVVLGMPWSYPIDLWGLAMTLWELFEPKKLFSPFDESGRYSEHHHIAQMISIMEHPPLDFIRRSEKNHLFWDEEGKWKDVVPIPETSLELAEKRLEGKEKELFLRFMRKMLQWKPKERESIMGVYNDEWLHADLIEKAEREHEN